MWGDESEAVAPIIWLYQIVDAQKEEVFFPEFLITLHEFNGRKAGNCSYPKYCQLHMPPRSWEIPENLLSKGMR